MFHWEVQKQCLRREEIKKHEKEGDKKRKEIPNDSGTVRPATK